MTRSSDERGGYIGEELRAGRVPQNVEDRTVAEQAAEWMSPEDKIRQGGRIGDSIRRTHPYASREELAAVARVVTEFEDWRKGFEIYMGQAFTTLGDRIKGLELVLEENGISRPVRGSTNLDERLKELELWVRNRDSYEAEMRDRG